MTDGLQTLRITLTGDDRPGVTSALLQAVAPLSADVLDLEQIVVRDHLTLTLLLRTAGTADARRELRSAVQAVADRLGMQAKVSEGVGDSHERPAGRAHVVVLGRPLGAGALGAVTARIAAHGANIDRIRRLSQYPVTTLEFDVSGADVPALRAELAAVAAAERVDVAVAPAGLARLGARLVVMDVDSTFIQQEVIELLAAKCGREAEVAAVTERAMRGELDFAASLRERVAVLAGLDAGVLDDVRQEIILTPGARTLVRTLKRLGDTIALVSGGFIEIVGPIAADLGIDHALANRLEVRDGVLTGRVEGEIVDRAGKAAALRQFAAEAGLPLSRTVAIGDGANDLDMLETAGLGVAFNAKPLVRAQADTAVNVPYLDTVLFLLGITREDVEEADALDGIPTPAPQLP
ncbi:MAG TPA: phosphoserine phosphatase SerB [Dermatophilaceae bacterium]|nr:phosphoserine phosphatase SerB [Actinomycetales bacterium]HMT90398.1 phosphoserine phosphatase SerB [Dermatophilaceae bacterium]